MEHQPLFELLRRVLGFRPALGASGHTQAAAPVDNAVPARTESPPPLPAADPPVPSGAPLCRPRRLGQAGQELIKRFEGIARLRGDGWVEAYPDPGTGAAPWTIGWGATGAGIGPGTVWSRAQCDDRLARDLERFALEVDRALGDAPTGAEQFDALVSFHYNTGAIHRATLTRKHCSGDSRAAAKEFARWNRAGGRVLNGLTRRRAAEAELYASDASGKDAAIR